MKRVATAKALNSVAIDKASAIDHMFFKGDGYAIVTADILDGTEPGYDLMPEIEPVMVIFRTLDILRPKTKKALFKAYVRDPLHFEFADENGDRIDVGAVAVVEIAPHWRVKVAQGFGCVMSLDNDAPEWVKEFAMTIIGATENT